MKTKIDLKKFNYYLLDTRNPNTYEESLVELSYLFWRSSWENTFKSLSVSSKVQSDDFLDRELSTIFYDGLPIALFFHNVFDVSRRSILDHSYFKNYPIEVIKEIKEKGFKRSFILSYMTIHPDFRSSKLGFSVPDLLFSLSIKRFLELNLNQIIGYIRTDKSFFESFYRVGANKLFSSSAYNVPVDFCYLTRESAKISHLDFISELTEYFWRNRILNEMTMEVA